jgi:hypothetical protein
MTDRRVEHAECRRHLARPVSGRTATCVMRLLELSRRLISSACWRVMPMRRGVEEPVAYRFVERERKLLPADVVTVSVSRSTASSTAAMRI